MTSIPRNDHEPGFIYLVEAVGYHGILSSVYKRCKIGLSRNPEARRQNFVKSQFPCDVRLIQTIYVENMLDVESQLHQQFDFCNVSLEKSQEWFDLNPVQYLRVRLALKMHEVYVFSFHELPLKPIVASVTLIFNVGVLLGIAGVKIIDSFQNPQNLPVSATEKIK